MAHLQDRALSLLLAHLVLLAPTPHLQVSHRVLFALQASMEHKQDRALSLQLAQALVLQVLHLLQEAMHLKIASPAIQVYTQPEVQLAYH
jgi:hypothetical protein